MLVRRFLRSWVALVKVGFAEAVAYRSELLVWLLATNMPLVMLLLWSTVADEGPVGRFGQREFTAYFLVTLMVRFMTGAWVVWEMNQEIREGALARRLLRPIHPFLAYLSENLAAWPFRLAICVPILVVAVWKVGLGSFSGSSWQLALVPIAIVGAWALNFSAMLCIGTLGLWWESSMALFELWLGMYFVFSGYLMPLELFPPFLHTLVDFLPFPLMIALPVETALGLRSPASSLVGVAHQWLWVSGFFFLALVLWSRGVRRFQAYGG